MKTFDKKLIVSGLKEPRLFIWQLRKVMWSVDGQISSFALFLAGKEIQLYTGCPKNTFKSRFIRNVLVY